MALLEQDLQNKINHCKTRSGLLFAENNISEAIKELEAAWSIIPIPKELYDESYLISRYIVQMATKDRQFEIARHWSVINCACDPERLDDGEKEFLAAIVEFEAGEFEAAFKIFQVAFLKSEGSCFFGKDSKYKAFFKSNKVKQLRDD
jgi:hypothetical protein